MDLTTCQHNAHFFTLVLTPSSQQEEGALEGGGADGQLGGHEGSQGERAHSKEPEAGGLQSQGELIARPSGVGLEQSWQVWLGEQVHSRQVVEVPIISQAEELVFYSKGAWKV